MKDSLIPPARRPESSRLLGLLFAVGVLALASRWLLSGEADPRVDLAPAPMADPTPLRLAETTVAAAEGRRPVRLAPPVPAEPVALPAARPISAALCHALDERMKALDLQAAGKLPRHELRSLRAERHRARELLNGLRCRAGGDRYWF